MAEEMVTTAVDDLLEYLQGKDKVALQDAATVLNVPPETLQAWVDFLVEEKILGIEYKFTKPFIYLNREAKKEKRSRPVSLEDVRKEYEEHAKAKQIPEGKIKDLWRMHVTEALDRRADYFLEQAKRRRMQNVDGMWQQYRTSVLARC